MESKDVILEFPWKHMFSILPIMCRFTPNPSVCIITGEGHQHRRLVKQAHYEGNTEHFPIL